MIFIISWFSNTEFLLLSYSNFSWLFLFVLYSRLLIKGFLVTNYLESPEYTIYQKHTHKYMHTYIHTGTFFITICFISLVPIIIVFFFIPCHSIPYPTIQTILIILYTILKDKSNYQVLTRSCPVHQTEKYVYFHLESDKSKRSAQIHQKRNSEIQ